jgi:hypothetical protein
LYFMQEIQYSAQPDSVISDAVETASAPPPHPGSRFEVASPAAQPSTRNPQPSFNPSPGETPRAFSAFMAFFDLGHARSLPGVAAQLGEKPATVKKWSSRFRWRERIQAFNAGLLQQHAEAQAALQAQQAADWARRTGEFREQEWAAAQKLLGAVQCFLDSFGDRDLEKMTLSQVSRALQISSHIARQALRGAGAPEEPVLAPLQLELAAALKRAYHQAPAPFTGNAALNPGGASPADLKTSS